MQKPGLDDCYICLDNINLNYTKCAVFFHKCRHHICFSCFTEIHYTNPKFLCGICRAHRSEFMNNARFWSQVRHSQTQTIFIPEQHQSKYLDINRDYVQFLLAHSSKN